MQSSVDITNPNAKLLPYPAASDTDLAKILFDKFGLTPNELESYQRCMHLRCLIEGFASRIAACRVQKGYDKSHLLDAYHGLIAAIKLPDQETFHRMDMTLHREILLLSNIPGVIPAWEAVYSSIDSFRKKTVVEFWPDIETLIEAHRYLVEAICQGLPDVAQEAAERHTQPVWQRIDGLAQSGKQHYLDNNLDRILAYIDFHIADTITADVLAAEAVSLSPGHIRRLFRERLHTTLTDYLRSCRIKKSAVLLRETPLPVSRVRKAVGYSNASRFSIHFREVFGVSPSQFRLNEK